MPFTTSKHRKESKAILARVSGLLLDPANGPQPTNWDNSLEIIPDRLYWTSSTLPIQTFSDYKNLPIASFNTDFEFSYDPFYADFGPLHLGHTYRYCALLVSMLRDSQLADKRIVHCTSTDDFKRANAAYLMAAFSVIILGYEPAEACRPFETLKPPVIPFRDATYGTCTYKLRLIDCCEGLARAISLGWFDFDSFDIDRYEFYEKPENGDLNWIIPNKFLAFSGPEKRDADEDFVTFSPEDYIPIFHTLGVSLVIRLNKRQYDRTFFTANGINHVDLYFMDGSCPSRELLHRFLEVSESHKGAIAVHCKAGLGRTGTLIGCYAIKHYGFDGPSWIGWNRICRPGSVLGPQQQFLREMEAQFPVTSSEVKETIHDCWGLLDMLGVRSIKEMTLEERHTAVNGDSDQGTRLRKARLQNKFELLRTKKINFGNASPEQPPISTPSVTKDEEGRASVNDKFELIEEKSFKFGSASPEQHPVSTPPAIRNEGGSYTPLIVKPKILDSIMLKAQRTDKQEAQGLSRFPADVYNISNA